MSKEDSFSFSEIQNSENIALVDPSFITSSDEIKLAFYAVKCKNPTAVVLFIHSGGAYSGAGYQFLADISMKTFWKYSCGFLQLF